MVETFSPSVATEDSASVRAIDHATDRVRQMFKQNSQKKGEPMARPFLQTYCTARLRIDRQIDLKRLHAIGIGADRFIPKSAVADLAVLEAIRIRIGFLVQTQ